MINFTQEFDSAWERIYIILFGPFDFGKWFAIGLSAFLAGLLHSGFGSSYHTNNYHYDNGLNFTSGTMPNFDFHQWINSISPALGGLQIGLILLVGLIALAFIFAIILLVYWLGARGQFMLLDNIVRNRGAIAWPWHYYSRQANSLLGFYLLYLVIYVAVLLPFLVLALVWGLPLLQQHRWPEGWEIVGFSVLGLVGLGIFLALKLCLFIFREFGIAIMFRQGLLAWPAFWASARLVQQHPGSVVVFVLLRLAIAVGVAVLTLIFCCTMLPCFCLSVIPYVGTVLLLPVIIYVRCFTLDCLAQFG
ncbi:MAG TPA: hypothetical protein VGC39_11060, partial [Candidatus Methylacidiphilales bacterium]